MCEFIEELNKKNILSREDIYKLKEYIYKKNPQKTNFEKTNILSQAIHTVLDKNLQGINSNAKNEIKKVVLKNMLIQNEEKVLLSDIFEIYCSLCEESDSFYSEITDWLNSHIEQKISSEDLKAYSSKINIVNSEEIINEPAPHETNTPQIINCAASTLTSSTENFNSLQIQSDIISDSSIIKTNNIFKTFKKTYFIPLLLLFIISTSNSITKIINTSNTKTKTEKSIEENTSKKDSSVDSTTTKDKATKNNSKLTKDFRYIDINSYELKKFLNSKNSLLAEEPYFSTIISTSKEYDLNPLILFAITGQEQAFVPKDMKDAQKIANNPFNVYHSWKEYNTNIEDTCKIASVTIINICKDLPSDVDTFQWINKTYAEDSKWGKGVKSIFEKLSSINNCP